MQQEEQSPSNRRSGARVKVNSKDGIEAVIYADKAFPDFSDDYEINLGGIKLNTPINFQLNQLVSVSIFGHHKEKIEVQGTVQQSRGGDIIISFIALTAQQKEQLSTILELQEAL